MGKSSLLRREMLVDKECCRKIDSGVQDAAGIIGIEQQKRSMCEKASMRSASNTLCLLDVIQSSMTEVCQA